MRCNLHMVKLQRPLLPPRALPLRNEKSSSFKNSNFHDLGKIINICAIKNVPTRGSPKNCYGASLKMPPSQCKKRDPPHIEKNVPHMERMYTHSAHIEENAPIGEKKPPIQFFIHALPPFLTLPSPCDGRS